MIPATAKRKEDGGLLTKPAAHSILQNRMIFSPFFIVFAISTCKKIFLTAFFKNNFIL